MLGFLLFFFLISNSSNNSSITQEVETLLMRRAFDTTLPRASISRTRSGLRRLSSPTSRSHRPYAAGLALYLATSPYPQPVGSIGNPPFPSQRGLPPDIFGGARWEVYCRSIHPSVVVRVLYLTFPNSSSLALPMRLCPCSLLLVPASVVPNNASVSFREH